MQRKRKNISNAKVLVNGKWAANIVNSTISYRDCEVERTEVVNCPISVSRETYINRSWQEFAYQLTMKKALEKLKKYYETRNVKIILADGHVVN